MSHRKDRKTSASSDRSHRWAELLVHHREGEQQALNQLLCELRPWPLALARPRFRDLADAEDVVQEALLKIVRALPDFDLTRGNVAGWSARILTNEIANHFRRRQRVVVSFSENEPTAIASEPTDELSHTEDQEQLRAEVARLPARQAAAVRLRYVAGLKIQEMARHLGQPPATVASRLYRGLQLLRERLASAA